MNKVKVTGVKDKKMKSLMEEFINWHYEDMKEVINSVVVARMLIEAMYGIQTPQHIWDSILKAIVERDIRKEGLKS